MPGELAADVTSSDFSALSATDALAPVKIPLYSFMEHCQSYLRR
jgi:hypothetical protein